jgi:outer membrane immunogenic protein
VLGTADVASADGAPTRARRAAPAAAPAAPASNWTGGQFGGFGGGSNLAQNFAEPGSHLCPTTGLGDLPPSCVETDFAFSGRPTSATFGGFLGYRFQFGNLVAGIEGDGAWKRASESNSLAVNSRDGSIVRSELFSGSFRQGWDSSIRGRLGVLITPSVMAYGTAGVAFGEVCGSYSYSASLTTPAGPQTVVNGAVFGPNTTFATATTVTGSNSWCDTRTGYTAGGGVEAQVGFGVKARLEYRYTDLGDFSTNVPLVASSSLCTSAGFACTGNARIDNEAAFHTVRLGLGFDF